MHFMYKTEALNTNLAAFRDEISHDIDIHFGKEIVSFVTRDVNPLFYVFHYLVQGIITLENRFLCKSSLCEQFGSETKIPSHVYQMTKKASSKLFQNSSKFRGSRSDI